MLWLVYYTIFFLDDNKNNKSNESDNDNDINVAANEDDSEDENESISDEFKFNYTIFEVFENITQFYEKYKKDNSLLIYQKVLLFCSNIIYFIRINNIDEYIIFHGFIEPGFLFYNILFLKNDIFYSF